MSDVDTIFGALSNGVRLPQTGAVIQLNWRGSCAKHFMLLYRAFF